MERRLLLPDVWLTSVQTDKFKTAYMSLSLLRPLRREEASLNALLPNVLLRGTARYPDMEQISALLDELYGASLGSLVRKRGEVQTVGFYADCLEDRLVEEPLLEQTVGLLGQLLLEPVLDGEVLRADYIEGEKLNLINAIEAQINEKRSYAMSRLISQMCAAEAYGTDRMGTAEAVAAITPETLTGHWRKILAESAVEIFYMGSTPPETVAEIFRAALKALPRGSLTPVSTRVVRQAGPVQEISESMEVTQGKLALGLRTGICGRDPDYPALILLNTVLGGGVCSKLFLNVREKLSLCYYASSSIDKAKGVMLIGSGIETDKYDAAKTEILAQIDACKAGDITNEELENARRYLLCAYDTAMDSPGSMEYFYTGQTVAGLNDTIQSLKEKISAVQKDEVIAAAQKLQLDTVYFLKGVEA